MNAAIITKVTVSKTTGQTKLYAICQAKKIRVPWNNELSTQANHVQAALQLAINVGWEGTYYGGGLPDNTGYCFVMSKTVYTDPKTNIYSEHYMSSAFDADDMFDLKKSMEEN